MKGVRDAGEKKSGNIRASERPSEGKHVERVGKMRSEVHGIGGARRKKRHLECQKGRREERRRVNLAMEARHQRKGRRGRQQPEGHVAAEM
jgi:hypothetical protein